MNKELKINNNQELEVYHKSFTNLVNRYCAHPDNSLSSLIKSRYLDFLFILSSNTKTLIKHEQVEAIRREVNRAYGRFLDKRDDYLCGYKKKYRHC